MRTGALAVALAAVVTTTAAAAPRPHVERAEAGNVEAVFRYAYDPAAFRFSGQHLTIRREGVSRFDAALRRRPCTHCQIQPANFRVGRSVSVRDLDGDGEPEVVLDLYWGGAHCCWFSEFFRFLPHAGTYRALTHVWGDPRYRLRDLDRDGRPELVTGDDRFSYAFASFADSSWPVRVLEYHAGRLHVVTSAFAAVVRADAARQWRLALHRRGRPNEGVLAAWAADQCMLGSSRQAFRTLDRLGRSGRLRGEAGREAYLAHLRRFLRRTGYL